MNKKTIRTIKRAVEEGLFRNRSHAFEFSVNKILNEEENSSKLKKEVKK